MTERDAKETLEIFEMERNKHMANMPPVPYFDMVTADNFTLSLRMAINALEEIRNYREIGTVEECREAREKRISKKPKLTKPCKSINYYLCPECGGILIIGKGFCEKCGQAIDWNELN